MTEIHLAASLEDESYVRLGDRKVYLLKFTQYLVSGHPATADRIQIGDKLEIRTTGLDVGGDGRIQASQIHIV
ncbi:hypothetical protein [Cohnella sp. AR92]|uniref:hypothetical protein n=1 Tax=Cohnella sp. AR92 TaxID=648716 RepID=UPI000F8D0E07|nr:hypothetical protein [Cohnella sp. AR92]RUS47061.1 hypothetical protein ELR57_11720 [Cohnella sp. AR92]